MRYVPARAAVLLEGDGGGVGYRVPSPSDTGSYEHLFESGALAAVREKYAEVAAASGGGGGATGWIVRHAGDGYEVQRDGQGAPTVVSSTEVEPVEPSKKDLLVIFQGDLKGEVGHLIGIDGSNGIVKMLDQAIKIFDLAVCAKLAEL
mgnify:CR=1 FL=1